MIFQIKSIACSSLLLVSASCAFVPNSLNIRHQARKEQSMSNLHVSVVSEFLSNEYQPIFDNGANRLKEAFEAHTPESVGVKMTTEEEQDQQDARPRKQKRKNRDHRKHNYAKQEATLNEEPDLDFYTLHSSAVSHLYRDIPINDITRAIKRAQNLHDAHDLKTIGAFLIEECNTDWGYGFRGTLLSRLAVAALHIDEVGLALRAIETRRVHEKESIQPFESASIIRGLLRAGLKEEGWALLEDELGLPTGTANTELSYHDASNHASFRAHALSSIATRYFYQGEPEEAERALQKLGELGAFIESSNMECEDFKMPWVRLEEAAAECNKKMKAGESGKKNTKDFREAVWSTMFEFPCPGLSSA